MFLFPCSATPLAQLAIFLFIPVTDRPISNIFSWIFSQTLRIKANKNASHLV